MPAKKGTMPPNAGKGRPKGAVNKLPIEVKVMIEKALTKAGGISYLARQADANPAAFLSLVRALVPRHVDLSVRSVGTDLVAVMQERRAALAHKREDIIDAVEIHNDTNTEG